MKKKKAWILPLIFLWGYLSAWGMILVDRQMLIQAQEALRQELRDTKRKMKLQEMVDDFGTDWQKMVIWNEKAIEPPGEVPNDKVDK